jgi:hypothetical protein
MGSTFFRDGSLSSEAANANISHAGASNSASKAYRVNGLIQKGLPTRVAHTAEGEENIRAHSGLLRTGFFHTSVARVIASAQESVLFRVPQLLWCGRVGGFLAE